MRRASTVVVTFLVFLNATSILLVESGVTAALGVQTDVQMSDRVNEAVTAAENIEIAGGFLQSLFGIFNAVGSTFRIITEGVTAGPSMLQDVGVPPEITTFLWVGAGLIIGIDLIYIFSGRDP